MIPDTATLDDLIGAATSADDRLAVGAGRLLCAIHCGLPELTETCWQELISNGGLIYPALGRAMRVEIEADRPTESFKLSQLWKAPPFSRRALERLVATELLPRRSSPQAAVARSFVAVQAAVRDLFGRRGRLLLELTNPVVEAFDEHQKALLDLAVADPISAFRLGAPVEPQDLVDALPEQGGSVGLVDLACYTEQGLLLHLVNREQADVAVRPMLCQAFGLDHALNLSGVYRRFVLGREERQDPEKALEYIAQVLHDRLWCHVAKWAGQLGLSQLIIVPDAWTRALPHHLAKICGAEVGLPADVRTVARERLADLFPVEMAPTVQMLAINQWQTRPRGLERIAILADPQGDLPAARRTAAWMRERVPQQMGDGPALTCFVGNEATSARFEVALAESDLLIYAGHGHFIYGGAAHSHLALADGEWGLSRLEAAAVAPGSVQVLAACEVGAKQTGEAVAADALPGALVSAGSAAVLSALWVVEDLSFGYLTERFLHYLSHPGYRPSAALFRAMNDLKTWSRADVTEVLRARLQTMEETSASAEDPEEYAHLAESLAWFEDEAPDPPFASPLYWGAAVVFGGGWSWPAGAFSGGGEAIVGEIERMLQSPAAPRAIAEGRFEDAWELTHASLKVAHGPGRIAPLRDWAEIELRRGNRRFAILLLTRARLLAEVHEKHDLRRALEARLAQLR